MSSLGPVLSRNRVVICLGSGGVGKTTTAAALALHAAMQGKRVLCLTVDPARRLANSLGLASMTSEQQTIPRSLFEQHGLQCDGELSAMMLDTKGTFDELVTKHASSPAARDRILQNRFYRYVSTSLAGTQEYMAMEKLHAVRRDAAWDLIVLDTPPAANALDFLDAPERLVGAIDSPAMRWFVQAFEGAGKFSLGLVGKGAAFLLRGLSRFTGAEFLSGVAEFVTSMNELFGGFRQRATEVSNALRGPDVAFVIVTTPQVLAVQEALFVSDRLMASGMEHDAFVINSVHPIREAPSVANTELEAALRGVLPEGMNAPRALDQLHRALEDERGVALSDRNAVDHFRAEASGRVIVVEVPAFDEDVHDLGALAKVARYLTESSPAQPV